MRQNGTLILAFLIIVLISPVAFAMGGPPAQVPTEETAAIQPQTVEAKSVTAMKHAESERLTKSETELTSLEAERQKIENYLEILNKKIIRAGQAKNAKKLSELWTIERKMSDEEKKISKRILAIKEKHIELKPEEVAVPVKLEMPKQAEKPKVEKPKVEKPLVEKPKSVGRNIVYHDVVMGDTLISISRKYFGTPDYFREIAKMNNITDTAYLTQGTSLMIDLSMGGGKVGAVEQVQKVVPKPAPGGIIYHTVVAGDTLMGISRQYFDGSELYYKDIAQMNGIAEPYLLEPGMKLKIDTNLMKKMEKPKL
jgi:nucleoid-associated protein YgaU